MSAIWVMCPSATADDRATSCLAALLVDARDGRLDSFSIVSAGVMVEEPEDAHSLSSLEARLAQVQKVVVSPLLRGDVPFGPPVLAEVLLQRMHAECLTGDYRADCPGMATTLRTGDYNCATATALYVHLAARLGLRVEIVERPGHVLARLRTDTATWDIETTRSAGGVVPMAAQRGERRVSRVALVSILAYNRGAIALAQGDNARGQAGSLLAVCLEPSRTDAWLNLLAATNGDR